MPTALWNLLLRSGSAHCDLEHAVGAHCDLELAVEELQREEAETKDEAGSSSET